MIDYTKAPTRYLFSGVNVGSSDVLRRIKGPKGKKGLLMDFGCVCATTAFAGGTTTPKMKLGTESDDDAYAAAFDFGTLAVAAGTKSIRTDYREEIDAGFDTYMVDRILPADTVIRATMVAATGGGAAGVGDFFVDIIWAD